MTDPVEGGFGMYEPYAWEWGSYQCSMEPEFN